MNERDLELHLAAAEHIALKAGSMLLAHEGQVTAEEKHENDYVTDADKASEHMIVGYLGSLFPDEGFHGEEGGDISRKFPRWVIDPIDGTMNYMRGIPDYTISIGFEEEYGKPLLGVVYNVRQGELFSGLEGKGAWLNGRPISVSAIAHTHKALIISEAPHRRKEWCPAYYKLFQKVYKECSDFRCLGSIALEICYIAAGRVDAVFEYNLGYWDICAGLAILKAAGGTYDSIDPEKTVADEPCDFIATNGHLQEWLRRLVRATGDIRKES